MSVKGNTLHLNEGDPVPDLPGVILTGPGAPEGDAAVLPPFPEVPPTAVPSAAHRLLRG